MAKKNKDTKAAEVTETTNKRKGGARGGQFKKVEFIRTTYYDRRAGEKGKQQVTEQMHDKILRELKGVKQSTADKVAKLTAAKTALLDLENIESIVHDWQNNYNQYVIDGRKLLAEHEAKLFKPKDKIAMVKSNIAKAEGSARVLAELSDVLAMAQAKHNSVIDSVNGKAK